MIGKKAQASIETISIALIVIVMAVAVLSYFSAIQNSTVALGLARTTALKAINANPDLSKSFAIDKIDPDEEIANSFLLLKITTQPTAGVDCSDIDSVGIAQIIKEKKLYETVEVQLNGFGCAT